MAPSARKPAIQVGISIHNQDLAQIQQCVKSCLRQQGVSFRVDVRIDGYDGTTSEAREWLRKLSLEVPNFHLNEADQNLGAYGSYQTIFNSSDSDFLCQVDSDDALASGALFLTAQALQANPDAGMAYTQCIEMDEQGIPLSLGKRQQIPFTMDNHLMNFMTFHLRMIRRTYFNQAGGFNSQLRYTGDYDISLKLAEISDIIFINRPLYYYRLHSSSISQANTNQLNHEVEFICNQALRRRGLSDQQQIKVNPDGSTTLISTTPPKPSPEGDITHGKSSKKTEEKREIFYISPKECHNNGMI
tara:strand:- start:1790 stop:2695 length:906 start_codon:yes stop_codon:yes gene_type:complete